MPTVYDTDALGDRIALHAANLDAATHRLLTDLRAFDQTGGWSRQGFKSFGGWLAWRVGWDPITAREHVRVATKLGDLPLIDNALRSGEVSYSKVRAMTRVATAETEAVLLEQARYSTGAQLERICKKYAAVKRHDMDVQPTDDAQRRYVARRELDDGMVKIEAILHPEEAAAVWAALERIASEKCRDTTATAARETGSHSLPQDDSAESSTSNNIAHSASATTHLKPFDRADALVTFAQEVLHGTRRKRTPTELVVTVTAEALTRCDNHDATEVGVVADGTCISATAAQRIACDCGVVDVVEDERGSPLSIGRKRRTIPASMKHALLRRDSTCRFPGCAARVFLQGHHLVHWAHGGETKLGNLVSLCSYHHRFVHEYGFTIVRSELPEDQQSSRRPDLAFFDPRGRRVPSIPERAPVRGAGWPSILADNEPLGITADTAAHGWDGSRVDYASCVDALVAVEDVTELCA